MRICTVLKFGLLSVAALYAQVSMATDPELSVVVAEHRYELPVVTSSAPADGAVTAIQVSVDLSPLVADLVTILQRTLPLPHDNCSVTSRISGVEISAHPPGASVRIEVPWRVRACGLGANVTVIEDTSHISAKFLPTVSNKRFIAFVVQDADASGDVGRLFRGDFRRIVEDAVRKSLPAFDAASLVPPYLQSYLPTIEVRDVALAGQGKSWRIVGTIALSTAR